MPHSPLGGPLLPFCRLAFDALADLPSRSKLTGGAVGLIEDLYVKNAYSLKGGSVAKAILLSLELGEAQGPRRGGGLVAHWQSKIQLEHLLPQVG